MTSDGLTKTVTVMSSATACGMTTVAYTAPVACTVCTLALTTTQLVNGQVGTPYSQTLTTSGGTAPLSYAIVGGTLTPGLTLNPSTGIISGTPTTSGVASFTVKVTDGKSCSALVALTHHHG